MRLILPDSRAVVDTFTTDGTWTKPQGAALIMLTLIAGGGGGGAGSRTNFDSSDQSLGGSGGHGGAWVTATFLADALPDTVSVTVGAGSAGAAGVSVDDSAPVDAPPGAASVFGEFLAAPPVGVGLTSAPNGGYGGSFSPTGILNSGSDATPGESSLIIPGAVGGAVGTGGGAGSPGASLPTGVYGPGGGGGGGDSSTTANAGNGGDGAIYGAGGGGGGASANGFLSGAGGDGAPGVCIVTTLF